MESLIAEIIDFLLKQGNFFIAQRWIFFLLQWFVHVIFSFIIFVFPSIVLSYFAYNETNCAKNCSQIFGGELNERKRSYYVPCGIR